MEKALACYMDSLRASQWKVETLTNIAQVRPACARFPPSSHP
jgi:hypothetical protein